MSEKYEVENRDISGSQPAAAPTSRSSVFLLLLTAYPALIIPTDMTMMKLEDLLE